jgi:hypothetical protein
MNDIVFKTIALSYFFLLNYYYTSTTLLESINMPDSNWSAITRHAIVPSMLSHQKEHYTSGGGNQTLRSRRPSTAHGHFVNTWTQPLHAAIKSDFLSTPSSQNGGFIRANSVMPPANYCTTTHLPQEPSDPQSQQYHPSPPQSGGFIRANSVMPPSNYCTTSHLPQEPYDPQSQSRQFVSTS